MRLSDVMIRDVQSCSPEDYLEVPARTLWERGASVVAVVNSKGEPVGILTVDSIEMATYSQGRPLSLISVSAAMSTEVSCCRMDETLADVVKLMRAQQTEHLLVTGDANQLVGAVTLDAIRAAVEAPVSPATRDHDKKTETSALAL